jgi:hypothetical protein
LYAVLSPRQPPNDLDPQVSTIAHFDLVEAVVEETGAREHRLRSPPAQVVVYLVPAQGLDQG